MGMFINDGDPLKILYHIYKIGLCFIERVRGPKMIKKKFKKSFMNSPIIIGMFCSKSGLEMIGNLEMEILKQ